MGRSACIVRGRIAVLLLVTAVLAAAEPVSAGVRPPLIAGIPEDFPPTFFRDPASGQAQGFAVDLLDAVARQAGCEVHYVFGLPWDDLHRRLLAGEVDVLPGLIVNEDRRRQFIFTHPTESVAVSFAAAGDHPHDHQVAAGMKVGVLRGSAAAAILAGRPELVAVPCETLQHMVMELLAERLDLVLCPEQNLRKLAIETGVLERIHILHPPAQETHRAMALRPADTVLRDRLDAALLAFLATPAYQTIHHRWWGQEPPYWTGRRVLALTGSLLAAALAAMFAFHYRRMRRSTVALRSAHQRREAIFQGSHDAILLADPATGRITEVNAAAEKLFARPRAALVGLHQSALHPPDLRESLGRIFAQHASGGGKPIATEILAADGIRIPVEIHTTAIILPDHSRVMIGIFHDVRERQQLEAQLRQAEKLTALGQLAGGIAHDFNNQLAGIQGYAEMLMRQLDGVPRERAGKIALAAQRAADLTRQLLAFARKGKCLNTPVDLHRTIDEVVGLLSHTIDRRIAIRCALMPDAALVLGDPGQLQSALLNLAINARDAMAGSEGELRFATRVVDLPADQDGFGNAAGAYVELAVGDTGCGMDSGVRRRLFEPFFTTKEPGRGTGLGLAAVYGVVRTHGGVIRVDSEPGRGSTFTLWLPRHIGAATATAPAPDNSGHGIGRLLVVDDDDLMRSLFVEQLGELGYQIESCGDGGAAVECLRQAGAGGFALVIMDLMMPGLSGRDLFLRLREVVPGQRVLVVSGHALNEEAQALLDAGAAGFLTKPFTGAALAQAVTAAMR